MDAHLDLLEEARATGTTAPRIVAERTIDQAERLLAMPLAESPIVVGARLAEGDDAGRARVADVVADVVNPSLERYLAARALHVVQADPEALRDALYRQAFGPVRWVEVVQALRARGLTHVLECGPGKVLSSLVKRVDADAVSMTLFDPATLAEALELLA